MSICNVYNCWRIDGKNTNLMTKKERKALQTIAQQTGVSQRALIRAAIDCYITRFQSTDRRAVLRTASGTWQDHTNMSNIASLRDELDRLSNSKDDNQSCQVVSFLILILSLNICEKLRTQ